MRTYCRAEYLAHYTGEANHKQLMDIYQQAIRIATARRTGDPVAPLNDPDYGLELQDDELPLPDNQLG